MRSHVKQWFVRTIGSIGLAPYRGTLGAGGRAWVGLLFLPRRRAFLKWQLCSVGYNRMEKFVMGVHKLIGLSYKRIMGQSKLGRLSIRHSAGRTALPYSLLLPTLSFLNNGQWNDPRIHTAAEEQPRWISTRNKEKTGLGVKRRRLRLRVRPGWGQQRRPYWLSLLA